MRNIVRTINLVLALAATLVAIPAVAQNVTEQPPAATAQTLIALGGKLKAGDSVFVIDRNGERARGRLLRISIEGLALKVDGQERMIQANDRSRVEKRDRDSLANGVLIGALPAALFGALMGALGAGQDCSPPCDPATAQGALLGGAILGGIGAGIGALIDFGHPGSVVVYESGFSSVRVRAIPYCSQVAPGWRSQRASDQRSRTGPTRGSVQVDFIRPGNS